MTSDSHSSVLDNLLIDTWWFGFSARLNDSRFEALAQQRVAEGFSAVQCVVGIPPEVAPGHPQAASNVGLPWDLKGQINEDYLRFARARVQRLNELGLRVVVYGAWGMQIEWVGTAFMQRWWQALIEHLDDLDVIYCISGEVDIWVDMPNLLLPDRSTGDLKGGSEPDFPALRRVLERVAKKALWVKSRLTQPYAERHRKRAWGDVLVYVKERTEHPVIAHSWGFAGRHSHNQVDHAELLDAVTVQTGHDLASKTMHWRLPQELRQEWHTRFINLEPWYEGIRGEFYTQDQLFAYWCNMLAGACSYAYGAHGVWNVGDGEFLAHWGGQTLEQAMELSTGGLLGRSHAWFLHHMGFDDSAKTCVEEVNGELQSISRTSKLGEMVFYPHSTDRGVETRVLGSMFDPLLGREVHKIPESGPLLVWNALKRPE